MYCGLFIPPPIEGCLGFFQVLAVMKKAVISIFVQFFFVCEHIFSSFLKITVSVIAGSYGKIMYSF